MNANKNDVIAMLIAENSRLNIENKEYKLEEQNMQHAHCHDCGLEYGSDAWIEAVIPDKVWNRIRPSESGTEGGLLCITCIARRLKIKGLKDVPVWLCGTENLIGMAGYQGDDLGTLRTFDVKE